MLSKAWALKEIHEKWIASTKLMGEGLVAEIKDISQTKHKEDPLHSISLSPLSPQMWSSSDYVFVIRLLPDCNHHTSLQACGITSGKDQQQQHSLCRDTNLRQRNTYQENLAADFNVRQRISKTRFMPFDLELSPLSPQMWSSVIMHGAYNLPFFDRISLADLVPYLHRWISYVSKIYI
ncbi:unnamed protein product [Arabidopsis halleri]